MVRNVSILPGAGQNRPLPLLLPLTFKLRMVSSMVVLAPHGKVAKAFAVVRLAMRKLLVSVDAVVGLEFLATTLAVKHIATVLPNCVLVRRWKRLESLDTDNTGIHCLSPLCIVPPPTVMPSSTSRLSCISSSSHLFPSISFSSSSSSFFSSSSSSLSASRPSLLSYRDL